MDVSESRLKFVGHYSCKTRSLRMRYLFAWLLGVPGAVVIIWFLFAHK